MPQRIQRKRSKGWRMPEGAVYVGRPSKWGNPIEWQNYRRPRYTEDGEASVPPAENCRRWAVVDFRNDVIGRGSADYLEASAQTAIRSGESTDE